MKVVSLRIEEDVKARWDELADRHGLNQSKLMREAIRERLEELEDYYKTASRMNEAFEAIPDEQVWDSLADAD